VIAARTKSGHVDVMHARCTIWLHRKYQGVAGGSAIEHEATCGVGGLGEDRGACLVHADDEAVVVEGRHGDVCKECSCDCCTCQEWFDMWMV
jgi:hypothetical protein